MKITELSLLFAVLIVALNVNAAEETGKDIYTTYCTQCHGFDGKGRGVNAAHMTVLPRVHTDPEEMMARQDNDLFKVIKEGGAAINKSVLMPSWKHNLSDEQIEKLVRHLRVLCCGETP